MLIAFAVLIGLMQLPVKSAKVEYLLVGLYIFVLLLLIRNFMKGDFLVTLQVNTFGMYFQTSNQKQYVYVPWEFIGRIEKSLFPLNQRGIRIEVLGDNIQKALLEAGLGNVHKDAGRTFVYTLPQLHSREKLIARLTAFRQIS